MWNEPTNQEIEQKLNDLYAEELAGRARIEAQEVEQESRNTLELHHSYTKFFGLVTSEWFEDELMRGW